MSRHRIVRTMDYNDEYDGYDDVYGHSVDDDNCISPTDAQQWLYDRAKGQESLSSFIATHRNIEEEDEELDTKPLQRRDSEDFQMPILNDNDQARLNSCIDEIRTVVGECISEARIIDVVMKNNFDCAKSLNDILDESASSKPVKVSTEKPTIEKDLNSSSLQDFLKAHNNQTGGPFDVPNRSKIFSKPITPISNSQLLQSDTKSFNSLSDLANFHLKNTNTNTKTTLPISFGSTKQIDQCDTATTTSSTKFVIPKLGTSPKFIIPKLGTSPKTVPSCDEPSTSSSSSSSSSFILPKIGSNPTPHELSLKKIMDLRKLSISDSSESMHSELIMNSPNSSASSPSPLSLSNPKQFVIDLSGALHTDRDAPITNISQSIQTEQMEIFTPQFIDCEPAIMKTSNNAAEMPPQIKCCEIDLSYLTKSTLKHFTENISQFGQVLCRKFRSRNRPRIQHGFVHKHSIRPYVFQKPSPDDLVLKHMKSK